MKGQLTDKNFWEEEWRQHKVTQWDTGAYPFSPSWHNVLVEKVIQYKGGDCLEVGCFPGRYLRYFHRVYGMNVEGVDLIPYKQPEDCKNRPIYVHHTNFLTFKPKKEYDLVCSFGFIEHFENVGDVIQKHINLTKKGGMIIISVPNFVHGWRFMIRRIIKPDLFSSHNKNAMEITFLKKTMTTMDCRSWSVSMLRFSDRSFPERGIKKIVAFLMSKILKRIPMIDRGLSTEIILLIHH